VRPPKPPPAREPELHEWWEELWRPEPPRPVAADSAFLHYTSFQALRRRYFVSNVLAWEGPLVARTVGNCAAPPGPFLSGPLLPLRFSAAYHTPPRQPAQPRGQPVQDLNWLSQQLYQAYFNDRDAGPPASLYLAVRSAREALAADPDDARTQLLLAQAYHDLARQTRENVRAREPGRGIPLPHVAAIRHTQIVSALHRVLKLGPTLEQERDAHRLLGIQYQVYRFWYQGQPLRLVELEAQHLREYARCARALGQQPQESDDNFRARMDQLDKAVQAMDQEVKKREDDYEVKARREPVLQRAQIALQFGLAAKALKILEEARPEDLSDSRFPGQEPGAMLQLHLLLATGRLAKVQENLEPRFEAALGVLLPPLSVPAYEWFHVLLAAGQGDYGAADEHLKALLDRAAHRPNLPQVLRRYNIGPAQRATVPPAVGPVVSLLVGHLLLQEAGLAAHRPFQTWWCSPSWEALLVANAVTLDALTQEADLRTLRAWLALEGGDMEEARRQVGRALELTRVGNPKDGPVATMNLPSRNLALLCQDLLDSGRRR
jgi:hypothetical protein